MMLNFKIITSLMAFILLISCSSAEYNEALLTYEQAQKSHKLSELVSALKKLAELKPQQYQEQLTIAEQAQIKLTQAHEYLAQEDDYLAYLSSHDSYRSLPSIESKDVLVKSGKKLITLLKIKRLIDDSHRDHSLMRTALYEKYHNLPINDWDLIEVNKSVNQLSKNISQLKSALNGMKNSAIISSLAEMPLLQSGVEEQLRVTIQARDYLPKLAKHRSASVLNELNKTITEESIELLFHFRSDMAKRSIQPSLIKARETYSPFQNLVTNLSLATNIYSGDKHADWFNDWREIEIDVLEPEGEFSNYPLQNKKREKKLNQFTGVNITKSFDTGDGFTDIDNLNPKYPMIDVLIKKLAMDKSILL